MSQLLSDEPDLVEDVMTRNPITVSSSATVQEAALAMREADVGDVLVMRGDAVCGILTDRDIVVRFVADGGFVVPDVLRPYVAFERVEPRK